MENKRENETGLPQLKEAGASTGDKTNPPGKFLVIGRRRRRGKGEDNRYYFRNEDTFESYEDAGTFIGIELMEMEDIEFAIVEVVE